MMQIGCAANLNTTNWDFIDACGPNVSSCVALFIIKPNPTLKQSLSPSVQLPRKTFIAAKSDWLYIFIAL
jgi:hypothetical protein